MSLPADRRIWRIDRTIPLQRGAGVRSAVISGDLRGRLVNIALATIFDLASAFTEPATAGSASPWPSAQRHRKRGWCIFTSLSCLWIRSSWAIWRIRSASEANVP